jgi:hypothetical protein
MPFIESRPAVVLVTDDIGIHLTDRQESLFFIERLAVATGLRNRMNRPTHSGFIEALICAGRERREDRRGVSPAFATGCVGRFMR